MAGGKEGRGVDDAGCRRLATAVVCEAWSIACRQREQISVTEWANRNRYFAQGESFKSQDADAKYSIDDAPFQREPQDELLNGDAHTHVWMMASRIAKTVMIFNAIGYFSEHEPTTILVMYPTQEGGDLRSKEGLQPMIDASPALRGKFSQSKAGSGDNTITFKRFIGGSVAFIGSNAPSKLRARTARVVFADEADAYRSSSGHEGDPLRLLFNRAKNYRNPVRVIASTPTTKGHSRIESWFEKSDKRMWFVKCQAKGCGERQVMKWAHYKWTGDNRASCKWHCEVCDYAHNDRQRDRAIREGEWRPTAPFNGIRGYFLPGFYSIFPSPAAFKGKMHEMADEVWSAKHSQDVQETTRVLVNTFFCETFIPEADVTPDWVPMYERREHYDRKNLPNEIIYVTAGTDFQIDRIEIVFWGHGRDEEKWRIEKQIVFGDPRMPEIYSRMEEILLQPFTRQDHATLRVRAAGFDTGYAACQRRLYEWIRPRQRLCFWAFKGSSKVEADPVTRGKKSKVDRVILLMAGVNRIKALIYNRATITNPGPGFIHFSQDMVEQDFRQLFSEESQSVFRAGVQYKQFSLPTTGGVRNEELDCAVLAHAAFYARGLPNYDAEEKRNRGTIPVDGKPERAEQVSMPLPRSRRGWMSGFGRV
jgi:phage terminase large subunit GpA-like protein